MKMAVLPPFSTKRNSTAPLMNFAVNGTRHLLIGFCALFLFFLQLTSTAKTNGK